MSKGTILSLGLGIVIGAAGMWFMDNSKQPAYQVDEVIEGYSIPAAPANNTTAPAPAHNDMGTNNTDMNQAAPAQQPVQGQ